MTTKKGLAPLPPKYTAALRMHLGTAGEQWLVEQLNLSRQTIARAASGLKLHPATRNLIVNFLDAQ